MAGVGYVRDAITPLVHNFSSERRAAGRIWSRKTQLLALCKALANARVDDSTITLRYRGYRARIGHSGHTRDVPQPPAMPNATAMRCRRPRRP